MIVDVLIPKMGESITEGTIVVWYKKIGDSIEKYETLLEIGTDKVDSEIPAPESGTVCDILAKPNDVIDVGKIIARIDTSGGSHQPSEKIEEVETNEEQKQILKENRFKESFQKYKNII